MNVDFIKWVVGYAYGFDYVRTGKECYRVTLINRFGTWCMTDVIEEWEHYPLLLRRAVEGWNEKGGSIQLNDEVLLCSDPKESDVDDLYSNYTKTDYLTPQEQAIEACLIELLENK